MSATLPKAYSLYAKASDDTDSLTDREWAILSLLDQATKPLDALALAERILPSCPGRRTAERYARECAWHLIRRGLIEDRRYTIKPTAYQITCDGRAFLRGESAP